MSQWNGRGLPPVAADRLARAASSGVRTSLLSADGTASIESVGFDAVGEVMGCTVVQVGWRGFGGCGAWGLGIGPSPVIGSDDSRWSGFGPYVRAIRGGYDTALARLHAEAKALGADGVVDVRLGVNFLDGAREFMALGTAVRARSSVRPARPFATDLSGSDFAKLMLAGWVPVQIVTAFELAIKHDDWRTSSMARSWANVEIGGYTELVQYARHAVRVGIDRQTARLGADGFISSAIQLAIREIEPGDNHRDHIAETFMLGTAIAQFDQAGRVDARFGLLPGSPVGQRTDSRTVLPLRPIKTRGNYRR